MTPSSDMSDPRTLWENADWDGLRRLGPADLEMREGRARMALFVAAGHMHFADAVQTGMMVRQALDWGAARAEMIAILSAGLHNTAGRIALLLEDDGRARAQFAASVAPTARGAETDKTAFVRQFHEMLNLGLLPEAAQTLSGQYAAVGAGAMTPAWAAIMDSKIELMNHVLSTALARGPLGGATTDSTATQDPKAYAKRHSTAQLGQDVWVLEQSGFKRGGFFVEFGATNGILLSNTYLLETGFDWKGICAEPNPAFFAELERNRTCTVAPDCIAGESGQTVRFIAADEYGGIADYGDDDAHAEKRKAYADAGHVLELTTISLHDFLTAQGAPKTIDYLSIDTEGSEYDILAAFPFETWDIRLITVEHNFTPIRAQIADLLEGHGYVRTEARWDDWYTKPKTG